MSTTVSAKLKGWWYVLPGVRDIKRSRTAPGGCTQASFTMPNDPKMPKLGQDVHVLMTSSKSGEILWDGYVESPPDPDQSDPSRLSVTLKGSVFDLERNFYRMPYVVTRFDAWAKDDKYTSAEGTEVYQGTAPWATSGAQCLVTNFPNDREYGDGSAARMKFFGFTETDFTLGSFTTLVQTNADTPDVMKATIYVDDAGWDNKTFFKRISKTVERVYRQQGVNSGFPAGVNNMSFVLRVDGGASGKLPNYRATAWWSIRVYAALYRSVDGTQTYAQDPEKGIDPSSVFIDTIARWLKLYTSTDGSRSAIDTTGFALMSLELGANNGKEMATIRQMYDTLMGSCPGWLWTYSPCAEDEKHGVRLYQWPTTPELSIPAGAEWAQRGSDADLYNKSVAVLDDDTNKIPVVSANRMSVDSSEYPDIEYLEGERTLYLDLSPQTNSWSVGQGLQQRITQDAAVAKRAGQVVIDKPLTDPTSGNLVWPDEIVPGVLARLEDDGSTARITQVDWDEESGAATVSLENPRRSPDDILAQMRGYTAAGNYKAM